MRIRKGFKRDGREPGLNFVLTGSDLECVDFMKQSKAVLGGQLRTLSVMTAKRAGYPNRSYGYVIAINPPIVSFSEGRDIEGVGWWPMKERHEQKFHGWYRFKQDAEKRADDLAKQSEICQK